MQVQEQIDGAVEEYMRLPYRMEVYWDDGYWAAEFPELPGLAAGHEDRNELWEAIDDAKRAYFEAALRSGRVIPRPRETQDEYSGNLRLRLAKSVHRQASEAAEREGVSLNQFIANAVARELGRRAAMIADEGLGNWIELNAGFISPHAFWSTSPTFPIYWGTIALATAYAQGNIGSLSGAAGEDKVRPITTIQYGDARGTLPTGVVGNISSTRRPARIVTKLAP